MQTYLIAGCAILLLLGAGCSPTTEETNDAATPAVKQAGSEANQTDSTETTGDEDVDAGIRLTATQTNDSSVSFDWELPEGVEYDGFIIVRSENPNPEHTLKNYWFRQHYTRRSVTWTPLPKGEWNFRICGLVGSDCAVYSNNVTATIE